MKNAKCVVSIVVGVMAMLCHSTEVQVLDGVWTLKGTDERGGGVECPVSVPGGIYASLFNAGIIPDPYYGLNERKVQWPAHKEWNISRTFVVDGALRSCESIALRLEDVDTFATIFVNGVKVGECHNRFRRWDFDVHDVLKSGENTIVGVFRSAIDESKKLASNYAERYTCQNVKVRDMPLIRKPQCHAGWDWGPTLMDAGFCGNVKLIGENVARIDYVHCDQRFTPDFDSCEITVNVEVFSPKGGEVDLMASVGSVSARKAVMLMAGLNHLSVPVKIKNPTLWWPAGEGKQFLYLLSVSLGNSKFCRNIGLRKIELVNEPDCDPVSGKEARSFTFRVNGRDVFCKGCNWIPCDAMADRQTESRYHDLLSSAAAANMNMVRVWGGGQFEKECFYDMCDEYGLLVWQDLMFACGTYPTDKAFLANVREELVHQIKRLKDHPSIALWSGDNECYGVVAWDCFPEINDSTRDMYFRKIAERAAHNGAIVKCLDPMRAWWPSSPGSVVDGYTEDFADFERGDNHFWGIWFRNQPFETLYQRRPRFTDEFGYQSFPSVATALTFARREDFNFTSPVMDAHQKCRSEDGGRTLNILHGMAREFRIPESPEDMFWLSQVLQCEALLPALRYWRALRPYCMGMCVWQLNDNWPAISWSAIEYGGRWKQLMYRVRRSYASVVAVPYSINGGSNIEVQAVNDLPRRVRLEVGIATRTFGGATVANRRYVLDLPPGSSAKVDRIPSEVFGTEEERIDRFVLVDYTVADGDTRNTGRNEWFFSKYRECPLENAKVVVKPMVRDGDWLVTLRSDKPVFYLWLETSIEGRFNDNSLTLMPEESRTLTFTPKDKTATFDEFIKNLHVKHLRQTYR